MKKMFRATNVVLMLLCLMYFITYLDRVNVSTAAAGFAQANSRSQQDRESVSSSRHSRIRTSCSR